MSLLPVSCFLSPVVAEMAELGDAADSKSVEGFHTNPSNFRHNRPECTNEGLSHNSAH